jgi:hypothetical protein
MGLSQEGFTFGGSNNLHGALSSMPADTPIQIQRVAGLKGETHLIDRAKGRTFTLKCKLRDYSTWSFLMGALDGIDENVGLLTGTLTVTGNAAATVNRATFARCERLSKPRYDGSGQHGWNVDIELTWIQRSI